MKQIEFVGVCPNCGDEDLEYFTMEPDGNLMLQDIECNECQHTFTIWSSMKWFYDQPEDDDMAPSVVEIKNDND